MTTTKERKSALMTLANEAISQHTKMCKGGKIDESYNGQIAAFSVSIALSGLKPTLAIYHSDKSASKVNKNAIVELLAYMYGKENGKKMNDDEFYKMVCQAEGQKEETLKNTIIEYGIALKLTVRTFELVKS